MTPRSTPYLLHGPSACDSLRGLASPFSRRYRGRDERGLLVYEGFSTHGACPGSGYTGPPLKAVCL